jgi:hypothetical protein
MTYVVEMGSCAMTYTHWFSHSKAEWETYIDKQIYRQHGDRISLL